MESVVYSCGIVYFTLSRPILWSTQLLTQEVPEVTSLWVKRPEREGNHLLPSSAENKSILEPYLQKKQWKFVGYNSVCI